MRLRGFVRRVRLQPDGPPKGGHYVRMACLGAIISCGVMAAAQRPIAAGCIEKFDPTVDYFPDKASIEDAVNFSVDYRKSYKVVTMKAAQDGGPPEHYVLVQCGAPVPKLAGDMAGAQVVTVPIASFFAFSTTNLSLLVDLGRLDVLTGLAQFDPIASPKVKARIRTGKVVEFARVGLVMDVERIVTARPALLMAGGSSSATLSVIRNAGVPVVANNEWLESTALGRAEWLKYMALFLNEERKAQMLYGGMKDRYRAVSKRVAAIPEAERPLVMAGQSTRGVFTIAGGRSYVASMIRDAGGRYAWADNTAAGIASVDLEAQIQRAANADVWINGLGWKSLAAMREDEPRYVEFKAYRQGQVWTYERPVTPGGGNDYWTRSVTHPDLVLSDLVKIFHPQLASDHAFQWYSKLPAQ
jgi:iron complex transport system substrate-binding protein